MKRPLLHFLISSHPGAPGVWLGLALGVGLFYLAVSAWGYGFLGFPLDDAWIHQTYARNLARSGQWAFTPGAPSAGSTAPLWSLLLSLGYLLRLPFLMWTYGLGLILLGLTGWTLARLGHRLFPEQPWVGLLAGLFGLFEWRLAWAAVSGMETILFVWLSILLVERYLAGQQGQATQVGSPGADFGLGLLGGLLILTRPEGIGLVGLIGLDLADRWRRSQPPRFPLLRRWIWIIAGVGLLVAPYLLFHLWATGLPFPNTLYAKQAEYRVILEDFPWWQRLFGNFSSPLETVQGVFQVVFIGAPLLLLPGLLLAGWLTFSERRDNLWLLWAWWLGYLLLYGFRLPVTYQHGRYQIPAIAWIVLLGVWGTARGLKFQAKTGRFRLISRVAGRVMLISLFILTLGFTGIGARAYGRDVRFIESEMVATARWLDEHIASDALVAAHDIGAIGYFTQRPLLDLAGLITPEVIPIIRDEAALLDFVVDHQAGYLVTFPLWYPELTQSSRLILKYRTGAPWAPQAGGENMAVYEIVK